jgi:hypothetical protein
MIRWFLTVFALTLAIVWVWWLRANGHGPQAQDRRTAQQDRRAEDRRAEDRQDIKDIPIYEFAHTDGDVHVYKMVYQGCELYIARGHAIALERSDSIAIALGRGCGK